MTDLCDLDASALSELIRNGAVSPVESTRAVIERIEKLDPSLNAFITTDFGRALEAAAAAEDEVRQGKPLPPLHGVTFSVKDLIFTKDVRTTGGSELYRDFVPTSDDVAVSRMKRAGAILIGKTNLAEFGYGGFTDNRLQGLTRNPLALGRTPGGSTGGGAAAVAAGMGPIALGTDGGGSIRTPACFCGVVGFKPTFGAIPMHPSGRDPRYPGFSGWESVEHQGPLARTVADVALAFRAMAGRSAADRHSLDVDEHETAPENRRVRVAWTPDLGYAPVDLEVGAAFDRAVEALRSVPGWDMTEDIPGFDDPSESFWPIVASETDSERLLSLVSSSGRPLSDYLAKAVVAQHTFEAVRAAHFVRQTVIEGFRRLFERADILLMPAVAVPAWTAGEQEPSEINGQPVGAMAWTAFTFPMNLAGLPAVTVPCGETADGRRVSIQMVARRGADWFLLAQATRAEQGLTGLVPPLQLDPRLAYLGPDS